MSGLLAEVHDVDEVLASASGFGCGSGSGLPIDLCGSSDGNAAAPLGTSDLPIGLCGTSHEKEAPLDDVFFSASGHKESGLRYGVYRCVRARRMK